jgi:hypothetical protein
MNYGRLTRGAEWAVLAAVLMLHAVILAPFSSQADVPWLQIAADAQPLAAVVLVLAWAAFGPSRWWLRAAAAPLMLIGWAAYFSVSVQQYGYLSAGGGPVSFPFSVALAAAVLVVAVRLCGLRGLPISMGSPEPRPQFSIRTLLVMTTLVAVAIGCLEMLRPAELATPADMDFDEFAALVLGQSRLQATIRQYVLAVTVAGCALASLATVLRPGPTVLRLAILGIALPALGFYLTHVAGSSNEFSQRAIELTAALAAPAALVAISVLPLRLMGYRLGSPTLRVGQEAAIRQPQSHARHCVRALEHLAHTECGPTSSP